MPLITPKLIRCLIWAIAIGMLVAVGSEAATILVGRNFRTLIPGKVYRCAQPSTEDLKRVVARFGIRTVVNLRGCSAGFDWYEEESRATAELDIVQEDVSLSAGRLPAPHEMQRLVEVLDRAEYPILLHCRRGVDRTGLASAVVQLLQTDIPPSQARKQLSLRYGHVHLGRTVAMLNFFDQYDHWRVATAHEHCADSFRAFVTGGYCPGPARARIELIEAPKVAAQQVGHLKVRAHNQSVETWHFRPGTAAGIYLRYYVRGFDDNEYQIGRAGLFESNIPPGQSIDLTLVLKPLPPGPYRLVADLIDLGETMFSQMGNEPLITEFVVQ